MRMGRTDWSGKGGMQNSFLKEKPKVLEQMEKEILRISASLKLGS